MGSGRCARAHAGQGHDRSLPAPPSFSLGLPPAPTCSEEGTIAQSGCSWAIPPFGFQRGFLTCSNHISPVNDAVLAVKLCIPGFLLEGAWSVVLARPVLMFPSSTSCHKETKHYVSITASVVHMLQCIVRFLFKNY
jgi:hypothetical protein